MDSDGCFMRVVRETLRTFVYARTGGRDEFLDAELEEVFYPAVAEMHRKVRKAGYLSDEEASSYRSRFLESRRAMRKYPQLVREFEDVVNIMVLGWAKCDSGAPEAMRAKLDEMRDKMSQAHDNMG